jgi:hypothetical protein
VISVAAKTLRKYYAEILATAEIRANSMVAQSLFKKALGDGPAAVTAAIFWLKTRANWKETVVQEHAGTMTLEALVGESYKVGKQSRTAQPAIDHAMGTAETQPSNRSIYRL